MITTLTLDPAVDKTIFVSRMILGDVNRVNDSHLDPAGKGINVSRMVHRLGWPTIALGFLAGHLGRLAEEALRAEGVQSHFLYVDGETRLNVTIVDEATSTHTSFYDRGPAVSSRDLEDLDKLLARWMHASKVLVLAGSLPPGVPDDIYARYIGEAHSVGVKAIVDTHGKPLKLALAAHPDLIKPNLAEAEALVGRPLPDIATIAAEAQCLASTRASIVVISMGSRGAVCAYAGKAWRIVPPAVTRRSTVGSGDSMVAGLAIALASGEDLMEGLKLGTAAGAATAMTAGTALGTRAEVNDLLPKVQIEELA